MPECGSVETKEIKMEERELGNCKNPKFLFAMNLDIEEHRGSLYVKTPEKAKFVAKLNEQLRLIKQEEGSISPKKYKLSILVELVEKTEEEEMDGKEKE